MYKDVTKLILENKPITDIQLNNFITEYVKNMLNKDVTGPEILGIAQAIKMGVFNLRFAAEQAAFKLGLNILSVFNKENILIRMIISD